MANVYLATATPRGGEHYDYPSVRVREAYARDSHGKHKLVDDPAEADLILFATNYPYPPAGLGLYREELYKKYGKKVVLFNSNDYPSPFLGGLCASWHSGLEDIPGMGQGWCYYHPNSAEPNIDYMDWPEGGPKYLWSFKGSEITHPIRSELFRLDDTDALVVDTSKASLANLRGETPEQERQSFLNDYLELLKQSTYIACPRGRGASSMRIFEAMRAGRAPVIISDAWVPLPFIDWEKCSIRIAEKDIHTMPELLRKHRDTAEEMGKAARAEWERVLGPEGLFHYVTEAALLVQRANNGASGMQKLRKSMRLLQPDNLRAVLRYYTPGRGGN